jgi:hypothetical protein
MEAGFKNRLRMLDRLEFAEGPEAESLRQALEALNEDMFQGLRKEIRGGALPHFRALLREHAGNPEDRDEAGYDDLDVFLNGIFSSGPIPPETRALEPDMVFYQKTPGRIVLELVDRARFTPEDVFYDLGSGLGQVPLLVHLLSGVTARGVELEPAYVRYAEQAGADLNVSGASFLQADVREADLSDGTVFFLYTPFMGRMLDEVLENLRKLSERKPIRVFTYGPCTLQIARQSWLGNENPETLHPHKLGGFASFR